MDRGSLPAEWTEEVVLTILQRFKQNAHHLWKMRAEYPSLLFQGTRDSTRIRPEYHHLVFERTDGHKFEEEQLGFLLGPKWKQFQEKYIPVADRTLRDATLDLELKQFDLSKVHANKWISPHFDILGQNQGVNVMDERENHKIEIPPAINLAIALTLKTSVSSEGMFLWQPKKHRPFAVTGSWNRVPDILYTNWKWLPEERDRFVKGTYRQQRDFLCAKSRLQDTTTPDVVLPFTLDFEGTAREDQEDARVTADIDGVGAPKASISIPGQAFIGWCDDLFPDFALPSNIRECYLTSNNGVGAQVLIPPEAKQAARVEGLEDMCDRVKAMFAQPKEGGLVFYSDVQALYTIAQKSD